MRLSIHPTSSANEWRCTFIPRTCLHGVEKDFFTNATYVILCSQLRAVFRLILFGLYSNTTGLSSWRQANVTNNCARRYAWKFYSPARWSVAGRPDRGYDLQQIVKIKKKKIRKKTEDGSVSSVKLSSEWKCCVSLLRYCVRKEWTTNSRDETVKHWRQEMGETEFR